MTEIEFWDSSKVELIQCNASDDMVAMAAWVSNGFNQEERLKDEEKVAGLIRFLYRERHMSPFEHGQFTFKVQTPIFVVREWHRHRTQSYNEMSGRYTKMIPRFYCPPADRPLIQTGKVGAYTFSAGEEWQVAYMQNSTKEISQICWDKYESLKRAGIANEMARIVLPLNTFTEFYATVNPRNLMAFLDLRSEFDDVEPQALYEIRKAALDVQYHLQAEMPMTYDAFMEYRNG